MKFRSHNLNLIVVVQPARDVLVTVGASAGTKMRTSPLRAYFRSGMFDSVNAQSYHGWTEDERIRVEDALMNHREFEKPGGIFLEDGESLPPRFAKPTEKSLASDTCIFQMRTPSGAEPCGKPSVLGPYCEEHGQLAGWVAPPPAPPEEKRGPLGGELIYKEE
jgi:hypothetical protein